MQVGVFNFNNYMEKLNEAKEEEGGGLTGDPKEGLIIPSENKKTYDWLKKEYNAGKTEVKVEMKLGGAKFEPGYDFTAGGDTINDFKPGMYGEVKTSDNSKTSEGGLSTSSASKTKKTKTKNTEGSPDPQKAKKGGVKIKGAVTAKKKKEEDTEEDDE